jgi:hypothetical protein
MSKKTKTRIRNKIMKAITGMMIFIFALSVSCIDAKGWTAEIGCFASLIYFSIAVYIDNKRKEGGEADVLHR